MYHLMLTFELIQKVSLQRVDMISFLRCECLREAIQFDPEWTARSRRPWKPILKAELLCFMDDLSRHRVEEALFAPSQQCSTVDLRQELADCGLT